ncbi:MAG TPA: hypothetical protein VGP72_14110 [Planctomycetota bacterium]|jgi:tetratricopeptide (TPR) repeat protein
MSDNDADYEPDVRATSKGSRFLFIVLIVGVLLAMYAGFRSGGTGPVPAAPAPYYVPPPAFGTDAFVIIGYIGLVITCVSVLVMFLGFRKSKRSVAINEEGRTLLFAGELKAAADLFKRAKAQNPNSFIFDFELAVTFWLMGKFDASASYFQAVLARKPSALQVAMEEARSRARCYLAMIAALRGRLEDAERLQTRAHTNAPAIGGGPLLLMDVLIGARRERHAVILKDAEDVWMRVEKSLSISEFKALRLLCAFAWVHLPPSPENESKIQELLAGARPFRPGEFDYLVGSWPDLRAFLTDHGFCGEVQQVLTAPPVERAQKE